MQTAPTALLLQDREAMLPQTATPPAAVASNFAGVLALNLVAQTPPVASSERAPENDAAPGPKPAGDAASPPAPAPTRIAVTPPPPRTDQPVFPDKANVPVREPSVPEPSVPEPGVPALGIVAAAPAARSAPPDHTPPPAPKPDSQPAPLAPLPPAIAAAPKAAEEKRAVVQKAPPETPGGGGVRRTPAARGQETDEPVPTATPIMLPLQIAPSLQIQPVARAVDPVAPIVLDRGVLDRGVLDRGVSAVDKNATRQAASLLAAAPATDSQKIGIPETAIQAASDQETYRQNPNDRALRQQLEAPSQPTVQAAPHPEAPRARPVEVSANPPPSEHVSVQVDAVKPEHILTHTVAPAEPRPAAIETLPQPRHIAPPRAAPAADAPVAMQDAPVVLPVPAQPQAVAATPPAIDAAPVAPAPVVEQVAPAIVALVRSVDGGHRLTVRLAPEALGWVEIRIDRPADAPARIVVTVERPETLSLLQHDRPRLEHALNQAGLSIASGSVQFHIASPELSPAPPTARLGAQAGGGDNAAMRQGFADGNPTDQPKNRAGDDAEAPIRRDSTRPARAGIDILA